MDPVLKLIAQARRRLAVQVIVDSVAVIAMIAASVAIVLVAMERVGEETFIPWTWVAPLLIVAVGIAVVVVWMRRRLTATSVAIEVDRRLGLHARCSTALQLHGNDDPFAKAAVADAVSVASSPQTRERLGRAFPIRPPKAWWISPVIILAAFLLSFVAPMGWIGEEEPQPITQAKVDVSVSLEALVQDIEAQPALKEEIGDILNELNNSKTSDADDLSADEVRRDAIRKVTDLNRRLQEITNGEQGKTLEALDRSLKRLDAIEEGPGKELSEALRAGDFKAAKKALEALQKQGAEMDEATQEMLQEQLAAMAKQLEAMAGQRKQLEDALEAAGLDADLANNPAALKQALANQKQLTESQRQQLQQMAQAQQASSQMMQQLSKSLSQCSQGGPSQNPGACAAGQGQLSAMEQLQQLVMQAQAASSSCASQCQSMGQGLSKQGMVQGLGQSPNGRGGGFGDSAPTPSRSRVENPGGQTNGGAVIARQFVPGEIIIGESTAAFRTAVAQSRQGYDEAISKEQVPRKYHDAVMHYFGELAKVTEATAQEPDSGAGEQETTDSGDQDGE